MELVEGELVELERQGDMEAMGTEHLSDICVSMIDSDSSSRVGASEGGSIVPPPDDRSDDQDSQILTSEVYVTAAESFQGMSLKDIPKHTSILEQRKAEALQKEEPRMCPTRGKVGHDAPPLESLLKKHVSRLERMKIDLKSEEISKRSENDSKAQSRGIAGSLEDLVPHKSRLEQAKEESLNSSRYEYRKKAVRQEIVDSLEDVLVPHKSRLERQQEAFKAGEHKETTTNQEVMNARQVTKPPRSKLAIELEASSRQFQIN